MSGPNTDLVFQGQVIYSDEFTDGETVQLRQNTSDGGSDFVTELTADADGEVSYDTSDLETGDYFLRNSSGVDGSLFEVAVQTTSVSAADSSVADTGETETTFDVTSNRGDDFAYTVSAENLSASDLETIFSEEDATAVDADGDDENDSVEITGVSDGDSLNANFSDIDADDYTLTFDVTDTTAEDTADVTVTSVGEGEAAFVNDTVVEQRGDIAEITVELTEAAAGGSGSLIIGDEDEIGYQANVSFTDGNDDGEVTLEFNTLAATDDVDAPLVTAAADDDSVDNVDQNEVNDLLDAGDYDLLVSTGGNSTTADQPQDLSVLVLEERSTNSVKLWTASTSNADSLESAADVTDAVEAGTVTEAETVADEDVVVHQFSASGLEGILAAQGMDTMTKDFNEALSNGNLTATLNQTEASTIANQDPNSQAITSVSAVYKSGDTYFVVTDTDSFTDLDTFESGQVYNVSIAVNNSVLLDGDDAEDQTVVDQFEVADRTASFDSTPVEVQANSEQSITGTSTIAPGSELTIRVQSTGDTEPRFVKSQTVTVQEDGSFTATFDFSAQSAGDTFDASIRNFGVTADGEIVEAATETPTATETATETEAATETATETATATETTTTTEAPMTTEAPETTTESSTPGFGAILALVAMLAAALLATRRDE